MMLLMCSALVVLNVNCSKEESNDAAKDDAVKPDFEFVSGEIICPPHSNYQIGWEATLKNFGDATAEAKVQAWLSHDKVLGNDIAAGGLVFGNADADQSLSESFGATVENVSDYKYLILQIDHENGIEETDETNNLLVN